MKKDIKTDSMIFPNPVLVIGSYDESGKPNMMTAAWGGIVSGGPYSIGVSVRPGRYTHNSIMKRKAFTVNLATEDFVKEADYFGIDSGKKVDKLEKTNLTAVRSEVVDAPYIKEFHYILECEVTHTLDLDVHTLFVGKIQNIKIDEEYLIDGKINFEKMKPLSFDRPAQKYRIPGDVVGSSFKDGLKFR